MLATLQVARSFWQRNRVYRQRLALGPRPRGMHMGDVQVFDHLLRLCSATGRIGEIHVPSRLLRTIFSILPLIACGAVHAEVVVSPPQFDVRLALGTIDNLGQAEQKRDIVDDEFAELTAGAGYSINMLDGGLDVFARGFLTARELNDVSGLGHVGGGGELGVEGRLGDSSLPPFYRLVFTVEGEEYDFKQRDSTVYTGELTIGANFGPRATVMIGGEYRDRRARSPVFDLKEWSGFLDVGYQLGDSWRVGARARYVDGDVWSTVQVESPEGELRNDIFDLIAAAEEIQRDDAFNDAFDGVWFVYRLPATSGEYSVNVSRSFGERLSLTFEWLEVRVYGERDNDYDNRLLQLSLGLKF